MFYLKTKNHTNVPIRNSKKQLDNTDFLSDCFYYEEVSELTTSGGWGVDFVRKQAFLDKQARKILQVPFHYKASLKDAYRFYLSHEIDKATQLFIKCSNGKSFTTEIQMVTYVGKVFYARAQGKAVRNEKGEVIGIRGVFQNIELEKKDDSKLKESLKLIEGHNKWLYNLAHIVSHNLKAQVSNLQLTSTLIETEKLTEDQEDLMANFKKIGNNLDCTLKHLNIIKTLQHVDKDLKILIIQHVYNDVIAKVRQSKYYNSAIFYTEFSEVEKVKYIPMYLKNILYNLIINAIKNKHPERDCEVSVFTYEENNKKHLVVKDNGVGLDQSKIEYLLSRTHETFVYGEDKPGLGIFLIKSQVEAMGGQFFIESKLDKSAKFTVQF